MSVSIPAFVNKTRLWFEMEPTVIESRRMSVSESSTAQQIRAMVVTRDEQMIDLFSNQFRNLGVIADTVDDLTLAANKWLRSRIEGIVLDIDQVGTEVGIFAELRHNRSNQSAVVIAVATGLASKRKAERSGAQFTISRPFIVDQIHQTLAAAYRLMLRGRRAYFRLAASFDVALRRDSGAIIKCKTINLCRNGMAVQTPYPLGAGESLNLAFPAPEASIMLRARATVIWTDKQGQAGLRFDWIDEYVEEHLHNWLDDQCLMLHRVG